MNKNIMNKNSNLNNYLGVWQRVLRKSPLKSVQVLIAPILAITLVFAFTVPANAQLNTSQLAEARDARTVDEAVEKITKFLAKLRYEVPLVVNHQAAAKSVGLELRPTQVIYARPPVWVERRLVARSLSLALDLPAKILVFEDELGEIDIRVNTIGYVVDRHNIYTTWPLEFIDLVNDVVAPAEKGLMWRRSELSVDDAYDKIKNTIQSLGVFRIPLELDFSGHPRGAKTKLIVFGNPNVGTPLMQSNQEIALDLPQEMLVTKTLKGNTIIIYNDPFFLAQRVGLEGQDKRLTMIQGALARIAMSGVSR